MARFLIIIPVLLFAEASAMARHGGGHHGGEYCEHGCGYRAYYNHDHGRSRRSHWWGYRRGFGERWPGHQ
jgi:hypothetical protein